MSRRRQGRRDPPTGDAQRTGDARAAEFLRLVTSLADRMDAMPAVDLESSRARKARIRILRPAADAARRSLHNTDTERCDAAPRAGSGDGQ